MSTDLPDLPSKFPPNCETPVFDSRFSDVNSFTFDDLSIGSCSSSPQICQTQNTDQYSDQDNILRSIESVPITSALNCSNRSACICPTLYVDICPNFRCWHLSDYFSPMLAFVRLLFSYVGICPTTFLLCWHLSDSLC